MQPEKGKSIPLRAADLTRHSAERPVHHAFILKAFV
jgi:hypothetical protein